MHLTYGIRHHGPGSAGSLLRALQVQQPDCILIEGPPDADALIVHAAHTDMVPPVALLVYNPKNLGQASFFPFAEYSPEWQAIQFGLQNGIPVRFMDLPMAIGFGLKDESDTTLFAKESGDRSALDPFSEIALLAGYADPERWWEAYFERSAHASSPVSDWAIPAGDAPAPAVEVEEETAPDEIFPVILELMTALRASKSRPESPETLLREAYMRQTIRSAQKEGLQNIAVVCGAWHTPALASLEKIKPTADAACLKGLKKIKTEATWIPWSFDRLSTRSGYAAGVMAPAWYRMLWENRSQASAASRFEPAAVWLASAARLFRAQDVDISSAHVIESVRLANALATLRRTTLPGIEDLREAAVTVMGLGSEKPLEMLDAQLVVGDVLGAVPDTLPVPPLKADFDAQARSCRMERSTSEKKLELDLRDAPDLRKSILLHRTGLLGVAWGSPVEVGAGKQGRFHEHWTLKWLPDYEISLIEAGTWGNTVEAASTRRTLRRIEEAEQLPTLTVLLGTALKAELHGVIPDLLNKLQTISALSSDALVLADALPPLAEAFRYGQARRMDLEVVEQLLAQLTPRLCLQLPIACMGVNEDVAVDIQKKILAINRALGILQSPDFDELWGRSLRSIHESDRTAPMLSGLATRLLFDKNLEAISTTGDTMRFRLSPAQSPASSAAWLEGFLHGSGLLLLHNPALWGILDTWVRELTGDTLRELLPLLRRTFSRFAPPERSKMLDLVKNSGQLGASATSDKEKERPAWDAERAKPVMALLRDLFS